MEFAGMVDLARTPKEAEKERAEQAPVAPISTEPLYPYGMCLRLDDEVLQKIGFEGDLPKAGEMVHLMAMAKVTSAGEREELLPGGEKKVCRYVELQVTHLAAEDEDRESTPEEREEADKAKTKAFYGGEDGEDGEDD